MLRRLRNQETENDAQRVQALEGYASALFGLLLGNTIRCVLEEMESEITLERRWVRLRAAGGGEFAIAVDDGEPTDACRILRWAALLQRQYPGVFSATSPTVEPPTSMTEWTECEFQLRADDGWEGIAAIAAPTTVLETSWDLPLVRPAPHFSPAATLLLPHRVTLSLRESMSAEQGLFIASPLLYVRVAQLVFLARLSSSGGSRVVFDMLQEERMDNFGGAPITLDLGEIELSAEQLLRLRPGMKLTFERPAQFEATLRIAGTPWAVSELTVDQERVQLTITDLCDSAAHQRVADGVAASERAV